MNTYFVADDKDRIIGIRKEDYVVLECDNKVIDPLVIENHYSHTVPKNRWRSFGVYYKGKLKGAMQLGYGITPHKKKHICKHITRTNYKEFDRMWLSDDLSKNSESLVIGLLLRLIKKKYPKIRFIITYADGTVDNVGTIYQASNFIYLGKIRAMFFSPKRGERVHPITMWHRHGTQKWGVLKKIYPRLRKIKGWHYRYIHSFSKKFQKGLLKNAVPYPSLNEGGEAGEVSGRETPDNQSGGVGAIPTSRTLFSG